MKSSCREKTIVKIELDKEYDITKIRALVRKIISVHNQDIILDGSKVEKIDIGFVQLLVSVAECAADNMARIALRAPSARVREVFERAGINELPLPLVED